MKVPSVAPVAEERMHDLKLLEAAQEPGGGGLAKVRPLVPKALDADDADDDDESDDDDSEEEVGGLVMIMMHCWS